MASVNGSHSSIGRGKAYAVSFLQDLVGGDRAAVDADQVVLQSVDRLTRASVGEVRDQIGQLDGKSLLRPLDHPLEAAPHAPAPPPLFLRGGTRNDVATNVA